MSYDPPQHRRSIRLDGYDYTQPGGYFLTLVAHQRRYLFGEVVDGVVNLSPIGKIVEEEWLRTPAIRPEVTLDDFMIMPDHFHATLFFTETDQTTDSTVFADQKGTNGLERPPRSLGSLVAGFKAVTTHRINLIRKTPGEPVWLRNYYEHILRDENDLNRVRAYIRANPARWTR